MHRVTILQLVVALVVVVVVDTITHTLLAFSMTRKRRSLPLSLAVGFLAAVLMLLGGIQQTASLTSKRSHVGDDITFGPPVQRILKNTSVEHGDEKASEVRKAREAARLDKEQQHDDDESLDTVNITDKGENATITDLRPTSFPHYPQVQHLGVLLDAGRHYFPVEWIKDTIDVLYRMKYNFIHFRLTDDQAFNIQLESHPELAKPSPVHNPNKAVYSVEELTDIIVYASERNMTIMPEINVPGHAGAWAGIPNFVVPCPEFICLKGYGK